MATEQERHPCSDHGITDCPDCGYWQAAAEAVAGDHERQLAAVTAERDRYWQALVDIDGYEGWQALEVPAAKAMGDIARVALGRDQPEPAHDCEAELKARSDYSACMGTPAVFECSCGKRYAYGSEESEGAAWDLVEPA